MGERSPVTRECHAGICGSRGLRCPRPPDRPRRISPDDEAYIFATAKDRKEKLGRPFTRWSVRKLAEYLGKFSPRRIVVSRERLREILAKHDVTFQRTKTWKEPNDPDKEQKLDRIEEVMTKYPDRLFAFDEFGPLAVHPVGGCCWAEKKKPQRNRANYHKHCGVRQFHGCYDYGADQLFGVVRERKGVEASLAAIKSCRERRPDGEKVYVILGSLSAHRSKKVKAWCQKNNVEALHAHLQLLGQPDRCPLRTAARARAQQLRPPGPHAPGQSPARLPGPGATPTLMTHWSSPPNARGLPR